MKDLLVICATPLTENDFWKTAPLAKCLKKMTRHFGTEFTYKIYYENKRGLPEIYNEELDYRNDRFISIFVHDDVNIQDLFLKEKLNEAMEEYDVVGLAGGKEIKIKTPALWHLMSKKIFGAVAHLQRDGKITVSNFGPTPNRTLLLDGLFIAVNTEKANNLNLRFDETFNFHFYDLDFSLAANAAQLKIGVWPIWVIHSGLGDSFMTDDWQNSEQAFLKKWTV